MNAIEVKAQINKEFAEVMSHPDLDFVDKIHARSVRNWGLLLAPKIAEMQDANHDNGSVQAVGSVTFMTVVFDALKLMFVANPILLAIVMGVEGVFHLLGGKS